jgi:hypothetical protein
MGSVTTVTSSLSIQVYFSSTIAAGVSFRSFTNPYVRSYKAGILASANAAEKYEKAAPEGGSTESPLYEGKDVGGGDINFKFHITATVSQRSHSIVSETRF